MKVLYEGHKYELANVAAPEFTGQVLNFIQKEKSQLDDSFVTVSDGTTNEEVIAVLMDRLGYLNSKMSSPYNQAAISHLRRALDSLEAWTKDRVARSVEGSDKK